jgi:hypothetical protein
MRGSIFAVVALAALPVLGQEPAAQASPAVSKSAAIERLAYMAEYKLLREPNFAIPASIPQETTVVTARDSQGRQMTAKTETTASADQIPITHFRVIDPVAHVTYIWSYPGQEATVMALPFSGAIPQSCGSVFAAAVPMNIASEKTIEEDLGTKTIQGVEARGHRITHIIVSKPVGKPKRRQQYVRTMEWWKATDPGLNGLVVREVNEDAYSSKTSKELVNFSQGEPNPSLFQPPLSYKIVNREVNADPCIAFGSMEPSIAPAFILPQPSKP